MNVMVWQQQTNIRIYLSAITTASIQRINFRTPSPLAHNSKGTFAYVTIGGLNEVKVFRTDNFAQVATIPVGDLPHGLWPSGDGTRIYVLLENGDRLVAIDTLTNKVIGISPIGQGGQAGGKIMP